LSSYESRMEVTMVLAISSQDRKECNEVREYENRKTKAARTT